jgi:hypothetical protein
LVWLWFLNFPSGAHMAHITDVEVVLAADGKIVPTASFCERSAAGGNGAWVLSTCETRTGSDL